MSLILSYSACVPTNLICRNPWKSHAELKQAFPSADYVGNDRYVFNISGNKFRLVTIVVFFQMM